jgi:hypothetical protein
MRSRARTATSSVFGALLRALFAFVAMAALGVQSVAVGGHVEAEAVAYVADGQSPELHPSTQGQSSDQALAHASCALCRALGMGQDRAPPPAAHPRRVHPAIDALFAAHAQPRRDVLAWLGFRSRAPPV